jgi:hypothetical protein
VYPLFVDAYEYDVLEGVEGSGLLKIELGRLEIVLVAPV